MEFPDSPNWTFMVEEVSFGVFVVLVRHISGAIIRKTGTDPDALLEECRIEARRALTLANQKRKA